MPPDATAPSNAGAFVFAADAPPLAAPDARAGRPPARLRGLAGYVEAVLTATGAIDASDLALEEAAGGGASFAARVDLTLLDADGGEAGAALLAAAAALACTELPAVAVEGGLVVRVGGAAPLPPAPRFAGLLRSLPAASTLALVGPHRVVDPDAGEEALAGGLVVVAVGADGAIAAADAPGGAAPVPMDAVLAAAEAARARRRVAEGLLREALAAAR